MSRIAKLTAQLLEPTSVFTPQISQEGSTTPAEWSAEVEGPLNARPNVTFLMDARRKGLKSTKATVSVTLPTYSSTESKVTHQSKAFVTVICSEHSTLAERQRLLNFLSSSLTPTSGSSGSSLDNLVPFYWGDVANLPAAGNLDFSNGIEYRKLDPDFFSNISSYSQSSVTRLAMMLVAPGIIAWPASVPTTYINAHTQAALMNGSSVVTSYVGDAVADEETFSIGSAIVDQTPAY